MDFASALGAVGDVLDKPRQLVYQGVNAGYHALGGDPSQQIGHFGDLLAAGGMDPESWLTKGLGFAGDLATDPLTYAGGFAAKGLRGLLPKAIEMTEGAKAVEGGLAGASKFKEPLKDVATFKNASLGPAIDQGLPAELTGQPFRMEHNGVVGVQGAANPEGDVFVGQAQGRTRNLAEPDIVNRATGLGDLNLPPLTAGGFDRYSNSLFTMEGNSKPVDFLRHERTHAIIGNAADMVRQGQDISQLPAIMRYPAHLMASDNPFVKSLGGIGDELAAQSLESRSTLGQLARGAGFLADPETNAVYVQNYLNRNFHPAAVALYRSLPAATIGAGMAGGAGTGLLGRALSQD